MKPPFRTTHTPHPLWLGRGEPREDEVLAPAEVGTFLESEIVVAGKADGAHPGLSIDADGGLRAQSRGAYLELGALEGQETPLRR